jgi:hypothetical protein
MRLLATPDQVTHCGIVSHRLLYDKQFAAIGLAKVNNHRVFHLTVPYQTILLHRSGPSLPSPALTVSLTGLDFSHPAGIFLFLYIDAVPSTFFSWLKTYRTLHNA